MLVLTLIACGDYREDLDAIQADLDVVAAESQQQIDEVVDYASVCFTRYEADDCGDGELDFVGQCETSTAQYDDWVPCVIDYLDELGAEGWHLASTGETQFL